MERAALEIALWREVSRHLRIEESAVNLLPVLHTMLGAEGLVVRRLDPLGQRLETAALAGTLQDAATVELTAASTGWDAAMAWLVLQMGFRTLVLEKRSAEVWQVLGAVETEFGKFGDVLGKPKSQLQTASNTIDAAETRTRQMSRALRAVEALPVEQAVQLLPPERSEDG